MSFIEGYVVGSALSRGRYRPAAPGTGLLLYGGGIAIGAGLLAGMNDQSWGWLLAAVGLFALISGIAMQGEGDANHRPRPARYGRAEFWPVLGMTILVVVGFAGLLWLHGQGLI